MSFEPDPATESPEQIRHEIDSTRTAITEKLEALEETVMGTVQAAKETVEETVIAARETVQAAKETVEETIETVKSSVTETVETVRESFTGTVENLREAFDLATQTRRHPWPMVGGSFAIGLGLGMVLSRSIAPTSSIPHRMARSPEAAPVYTPAASAAPSRPGFLSTVMDAFGSEIGQFKGMAIAYGLAAARDYLKEQMPQLRDQLDDVSRRLTTHLGAEPIDQPVLTGKAYPEG
jgi:ElaB/YqjD/DUF883 family membrane-anchored ribosome-binding protein